MTTAVDQLGAQAGLPAPISGRGRPLIGLASQSYSVVSLAKLCFRSLPTKARVHLGTSTDGSLQASAWEQTAVLSTSQEQSIELLAAACSQRPLPRHVGSAIPCIQHQCAMSSPPLFTSVDAALQLTEVSDAPVASSSNRDDTSAAVQAEFEDIVLHSTNQFYKWHSELEAAFASETEEKYKQYAAELQGRLDRCADILGKASWLPNPTYLSTRCILPKSILHPCSLHDGELFVNMDEMSC